MRIYLMGAEQPYNRRLAREAGATNVGMSFHSLVRRLPKKKDFDWESFAGMNVYLTCTKPIEDPQLYVDFVEKYADHLALVTPIFDKNLGDEHVAALSSVTDKLAPIWHPLWHDTNYLYALADRFPVVSIAADVTEGRPSPWLNTVSAKYGCRFHYLDGASQDDLQMARFDSAATIAWLSPMKYGETIVWDGTRMQRYPKRMGETARTRHRTLFSRAGFDPDLIFAGNAEEITRFTAWCFLQLETFLDRKRPTTSPFRVIRGDGPINTDEPEPTASDDATDDPAPDNTPAVVRKEPVLPTRRPEGQRALPGFDFEVSTVRDAAGNPEERLLARKGAVTLRQCDSCHVAANCPAFQPGAECAYKLPIELRTKEQLSSALWAILEQQFDRLAFMMFQEQLNGGYADPNTSSEFDRTLKAIETVRRIEDNRDYLKIQVEGRANAGVMSRLFGERASRLAELEAAVPSEVIDAEFE